MQAPLPGVEPEMDRDGAAEEPSAEESVQLKPMQAALPGAVPDMDRDGADEPSVQELSAEEPAWVRLAMSEKPPTPEMSPEPQGSGGVDELAALKKKQCGTVPRAQLDALYERFPELAASEAAKVEAAAEAAKAANPPVAAEPEGFVIAHKGMKVGAEGTVVTKTVADGGFRCAAGPALGPAGEAAMPGGGAVAAATPQPQPPQAQLLLAEAHCAACGGASWLPHSKGCRTARRAANVADAQAREPEPELVRASETDVSYSTVVLETVGGLATEDAMPRDAYSRVQVGMKLEAKDRKNPSLVCVATIAEKKSSWQSEYHVRWMGASSH
jgi:hypothetical protein